MNSEKIVLFGTSYMAEEYLKVLAFLKKEVIVIGRNEKKAKELANKYNFQGFGGSIDTLDKLEFNFKFAIIASSIESLSDISIACIKKNIKNILIEKPGGLNLNDLITQKYGLHIIEDIINLLENLKN